MPYTVNIAIVYRVSIIVNITIPKSACIFVARFLSLLSSHSGASALTIPNKSVIIKYALLTQWEHDVSLN